MEISEELKSITNVRIEDVMEKCSHHETNFTRKCVDINYLPFMFELKRQLVVKLRTNERQMDLSGERITKYPSSDVTK